MKVYLRHIEKVERSSAGEMNPEQLYQFCHNLELSGIHDGKVRHDYINVEVQYFDDDAGFYAEVIWSDDHYTPERKEGG